MTYKKYHSESGLNHSESGLNQRDEDAHVFSVTQMPVVQRFKKKRAGVCAGLAWLLSPKAKVAK